MSDNPKFDQVTSSIRGFDTDQQKQIIEAAGHAISGSSIRDWSVDSLSATSIGLGTLGFLRVSATVQAHDADSTWSSVVKVIDGAADEEWGDFATPTREIEAYRSGFLADLTTGLQAAPCYRMDDRPDGTVLLWLKDMSGLDSPPWSVDQFVTTARHIGQFNGSWPERRIPEFAWIGKYETSDRRRLGIKFTPATRSRLEKTKQTREVTNAFSGVGFSRVVQLLDDLRQLVAATDGLPRTLAHGDCHARNLFPDHSSATNQVTYGIDWATIFEAPIGIDAGALFGSSLSWGMDEFETAFSSDQEIFGAYIEGLEDSEVELNRDAVRVTYVSAMAGYAIQIAGLPTLIATNDGRLEPRLARWGVDKEVALEQVGIRLNAMISLVDEALSLADRL